MRKKLLITCGLIFFIALYGNSSINYQCKALLKVLEKNGINSFSVISEIPVDENIIKEYKLHGKFFEIQSDVSQYKYIYTGRVNSCRAGGCSVSGNTPEDGQSEYFDYFILFDIEKTVQLVKVYNYQASHGQEITAKGWLKQFQGHDGSKSLQVDKNIDAISGATISVYAITHDVEVRTAMLLHDLDLQ